MPEITRTAPGTGQPATDIEDPRTRIHAELREWTEGHLPSEAGVELLIRQGNLLVTRENGTAFDAETTIRRSLRHRGHLSGSQRRVADVAAALLTGGTIDIREVFSGMDRRDLQLVLAALAHTAGGHQHAELNPQPGAHPRIVPLPPVHPWPQLGPKSGPDL
ncbi:hypothetical protein [Salana multivorans]